MSVMASSPKVMNSGRVSPIKNQLKSFNGMAKSKPKSSRLQSSNQNSPRKIQAGSGIQANYNRPPTLKR